MNNITETLKLHAIKANKAGYYSWRDAMISAIREIENLRDELEMINAAYDFVSEYAEKKLKELDA